MFATAKSITPAVPAPKAGKSKPELKVKGVEQLAMIRALEKALEAVSSTIDGEVKAAVFEHYVEQIALTGLRPENVRAVDAEVGSVATASVALSKKAANVALTDAQIALLREHKLEPHRDVVMPKLFAVNPAYAEDEALLGKVTQSLAGVVPDDFIVVQEERARFVVTDELLNKALAAKAPREVLQVLTSMSSKPQLAETNINRILDYVRGLITTPATAEPANKEQVAPKSKKAKAA